MSQVMETLHAVVASIETETHEVSACENGMLTVRDLHSLLHGDEAHPEEFVRLNQQSVKMLRDFLNSAEVTMLLS